MARILICHVPKDGGMARDMGAALMGRGHFVSFDGEPDTPRAERAPRLRQFEAVVVLWTEISAPSPGLSEIARETLPLNVLVPVKAPDMDHARIPLAFRKLNMLAPRDTDGIARLVARLSSAASSMREMAEHEAQRKKAGKSQSQGAPAAAPLPTRADVLLPAAPRGVVRVNAPSAPAQVPQASSPVVAAASAVRARPLSGLPEVEPDPDLFPGARENVRPPSAYAQHTPPVPRQASPSVARGGRYPHEDAAAFEVPPPPPPAEPSNATVLTADDLSRAVDEGLLVWHLPEAMWLAEPVSVEIALRRGVLGALFGYEERQSIETMSISLYGHRETFAIERQSERTQFVGEARPSQAWRDPGTYGRWAWIVTPQVAGSQDLVVRVSAVLRDRQGVPVPVALPDRRFAIDVQIPEGQNLMSALAGWRRR